MYVWLYEISFPAILHKLLLVHPSDHMQFLDVGETSNQQVCGLKSYTQYMYMYMYWVPCIHRSGAQRVNGGLLNSTGQ